MKKNLYVALCLAVAVSSMVACKKKKDDEKTTPTPANVAPTAAVTFPTSDYAVFVDGDTSLTLAATATDSDGSISKVEFYVDDVRVGEDVTSPYTYSVLFGANDAYFVKVVATDDKGLSTTSAAHKASLYHN